MKNKSILRSLKQLRKSNFESLTSGICSNLEWEYCTKEEDYREVQDFLSDCFYKLGLDTIFPVPSPLFNNEISYFTYGNNLKWTGKYGENRIYLLDLLIKIASGEEVTPKDVVWPHPHKGGDKND